MNIIVTGGLGYVGRHLVRQLTDAGHKVVTIDRRPPLGIEIKKGKEWFIQKDITDNLAKSSIIGDLEDTDTIIHLAAMIDAPQSVRLPLQYYDVNLSGTLNVLDLAKVLKVKRFVFASSAAVYGSVKEHAHYETQSNLKPENPYGSSKLFCESVIRDVCQFEGIHHASLRFFNIVGSNPAVKAFPANGGLFSRVVKNLISQEPLKVYGNTHRTPDGYAVRDYIHVDDVASGIIASLNRLSNEHNDLVYNLGSGKGTSVKQVIELANKIRHNKKVMYEECPMREGEASHSIADMNLIYKDMEWTVDKPCLLQALKEEFDARVSV